MKGTWWSKDEQAPFRKSQEGRVASPIRLEVLPVKLVAHRVGNQIHEQTTSAGVRNTSADRIDNTARDKQQDTFPQRKRCPHHLHAQLVRFDPAGQAWCDKLDCWYCYRLMKIGEALDYRCLLDQGRKAVIDQGMTAWILSRSWPALNEFRTLRIRMCRSSLFISSHLKSLVLLP